MLREFSQFFPTEGVKILLVLFLSFLIGLEREEHKDVAKQYSFGGVRTFPLIGLIGYVMALLSGNQRVPLVVGFAVIGALLVVSYRHKLLTRETSGVTSEMSALGTYLLGALVYYGYFWIATTIAVASMFLLELKVTLEGLTKRIAPEEILTFTKFLLLTVVILPVLPNEAFTQFQINPFKTWLVVVAVSAVSYGSYVLFNLTKGKGGVVISAFLGGAYSSTVTTVALAKRASHEQRAHLFSGAVLIASGVMYLRLILLLALFNRGLVYVLGLPFLFLAGVAILAGWLWSRIPDARVESPQREFQPQNPLELRAALLFAALFLAMLVATRLAAVYLGHKGIYALAAIMGVTDVDPYIMGMAQSAGSLTPLLVSAISILLAAVSNNLVKGIYAYSFADRKTGAESLGLLAGLAVLGLTPLLWLWK
jgi:uncharacterized membrane protein (DUF4010 family)